MAPQLLILQQSIPLRGVFCRGREARWATCPGAIGGRRGEHELLQKGSIVQEALHPWEGLVFHPRVEEGEEDPRTVPDKPPPKQKTATCDQAVNGRLA
eukprot:4193437-Pyramimonas_sp.AAC.2